MNTILAQWAIPCPWSSIKQTPSRSQVFSPSHREAFLSQDRGPYSRHSSCPVNPSQIRKASSMPKSPPSRTTSIWFFQIRGLVIMDQVAALSFGTEKTNGSSTYNRHPCRWVSKSSHRQHHLSQ